MPEVTIAFKYEEQVGTALTSRDLFMVGSPEMATGGWMQLWKMAHSQLTYCRWGGSISVGKYR